MRWAMLGIFVLVFAYFHSIQEDLPRFNGEMLAAKRAEAEAEKTDEHYSSNGERTLSHSRTWKVETIGHEPTYAPARAIVIRVEDSQIVVRPGKSAGLRDGLRMRIFRGSEPKDRSQWAGSATVIVAEQDEARLELAEGAARPTDFVISDEIELNETARLPKATHRERPSAPRLPTAELAVRLKSLSEQPGLETVSFGVPFPPGAIQADTQLTVWLGDRELPVASQTLAPWRWAGFPATPRSVLVQFPLDFRGQPEQTVVVRWNRRRTPTAAKLTPVHTLLFKRSRATTIREQPAAIEYEEPRVLAVLPPEWLCASWVAGPQTAVQDNKLLPDLDRRMLDAWRGIDVRESVSASTLSGEYIEHQLDRTILLYRMYARTGEPSLALDAWRHATLYRGQVVTEKQSARGRGAFALKHSREDLENEWLDVKYAYSEGPAVHYLLSGDSRFLDTLRDLNAFWASEFGQFIQADYSRQPDNWTERFSAFAWLNWLHTWQILGDNDALELARAQCANVANMQFFPGDRYAADGSWRHSGVHHGEGLESLGSSPWMSALLVDAIFQHWLATGDDRCPDMLVAYAEFAERYAVRWFSWADQTEDPSDKPRWAMPWYYASAVHGGYADTGGERDHNLDVAYIFFLGHHFRRDPRYLYWGQELIRSADGAMHPRMFNWSFRASPQSAWLLKQTGVTADDLETLKRPE